MKTNTNNLVPILLLFLTLFFSCEQQEKEVAISSVSLNQPSAEMIIGETVQLTATISPSSATDKSIIWSSSKQSVATVSESGLVTAVAVGSTTITAAAGGKTGSCVITVSKGIISVDTIELNKTELFLYEEDEFVLEATIKPDNATDKSISWKSSNKDIASVDNNGRVVALKKGDAIITATANDGGKTARCLVSIIKHLSPSETIGVEHISAVSAILSGKANFETTVSADLMLGFQYSKSAGILPSNSTTIEVTEADADYNYSAVVKELEPNTTYYFRSFIRQHGQDTYGETKEFTTNDINSVLETGVSYNIEAKRACLKAKLDLTDVQYGSISYGFYWGRTETTLNSYLKGEEVADNSYTALVDNLSPVTQYWYKAYLKLDEQVFYGDVKTFTTNAVLVESVSLDRSNYTFNTIGSSLTLHATVLPSDASDKGVSWSSDSEEVATVDSNGKVTSVINGTATITVKTNDQGKTATCVITVAQRVTSIVLDNSTLEIEEGETQTLIATVNPDNAYDKTLTWTSLDDQIATVDSNGNVTAVSKGTTTIIATANDGSNIKASCTIIVREVFKAIDLGLSVRWANYNVGANSSEEFGDYFAWGEIEPYYTEGHAYDKNCTSWKEGKAGYTWTSYQWCNGAGNKLIKYCPEGQSSYWDGSGSPDNLTVLDNGDDVVQIKLGGGWRMPTKSDWEELYEKCSWTWTSISGVKGVVIIGPNGNQIFLPAAGHRRDYYYSQSDGSSCSYWSSSLNSDNPCEAWYFDYYPSDSRTGIGHYYRYYGRAIRPVIE